ncbi:MAG: ribonuclease P protein component [Burkholderiales bacterium]|nr:ribonuclease P protein component [Burkholderiales bacterium]
MGRLRKAQRLSGQDRFRAVLRTPAIVRRPSVEGYARPNELGFARLGIVIGRKAARRAVDRNQCKRWVREQFRAAQFNLAGLDVVLRFRPGREGRTGGGAHSEVIEVLSAIARCRDSLSA